MLKTYPCILSYRQTKQRTIPLANQNKESIYLYQILISIITSFCPSKYHDVLGKLAKHMQTSIMVVYQLQFEHSLIKFQASINYIFQRCIQSSLKSSICHKVCLHQPTSTNQAIKLTKLIEEYFSDGQTKLPPFPSLVTYEICTKRNFL